MEQLPPDGTEERFDYLLDAYVAEVRLAERVGYESYSLEFYRGMLRQIFKEALERKERDERADPRPHA